MNTNSCLLVIDVQPDFYKVIKQAFPDFNKNLSSCLSLARKQNIPIIHIRANYSRNNSKWMNFWDELVGQSGKGVQGEVSYLDVCLFAKDENNETVIAKQAFDGFFETNLHSILQEMNISHVYMTGMVTSCCVLFTAASAFFRGYKVTMLTDCCADRSKEKQQTIFDIYGQYMFYSKSYLEI